MEKLYDNLYKLLILEIQDLGMGALFNRSRLNNMIDLINAVDYIKYGGPTRSEIIKILKHYE